MHLPPPNCPEPQRYYHNTNTLNTYTVIYNIIYCHLNGTTVVGCLCTHKWVIKSSDFEQPSLVDTRYNNILVQNDVQNDLPSMLTPIFF